MVISIFVDSIKRLYQDGMLDKDKVMDLYKNGKLKYEIETFTEDGKCKIKYYR